MSAPAPKRKEAPGSPGAAAKSARASSSPVARVFFGRRVYVSEAGATVPAAVLVSGEGKITSVVTGEAEALEAARAAESGGAERVDVADGHVLLPGVVDSHVHCNDPGRSDWEGFTTAMQAAARGGVTCITDMPLNSLPPTTTVPNLQEKRDAARGRCWTDLTFWGGFVDDNTEHLRPLTAAGVRGFKCFLIHSGVPEFKHVRADQVPGALEQLRGTGRPLLFHAEMELSEDEITAEEREAAAGNPEEYHTFLCSRPKRMENKAIAAVIDACKSTGVPCHIVHLSSSEALPMIREAKAAGAPLTVETCYHYLFFESESIPRGQPRYKCCPPIREKANREKLWEALADGTIDMVVSDHSPCTADLKETPNYMEAWGGISSLQFGLSVMQTAAPGGSLEWSDVARWLSEAPARLIGLGDRKGRIAPGYDADLAVFDPAAELPVTKASILFKNKISAYEGLSLRGEVKATYLRGRPVWRDGAFCDKEPFGEML